MKKLNFTLSLLAVGVLSACGSDSDNSTTGGDSNPPQEQNVAPIAAADSAEVKVGDTVSIDVVANDTDEDDDTLELSDVTEPANGSVELTSDNQINYTPNDGFLGADTFEYTVSDGEDSATAEVNVAVYNELALSGRVVDDPIANAAVTVSVGSEETSVEADADGYYEATVRFSDNNQLVQLTAVGAEGQENVELSSYVGATGSLTEAAGEDGLLERAESSSVYVTNVTTAYKVLAEQANAGEAFASYEDYATAAESVSSDDALEVAAVIKLIIDDPTIDQPEGYDSVVDFVADTEAYEQFVESVTESNPDLIADTQQAILADEELIQQPSAEQLAGTYITGYEPLPFMPLRANIYFTLNADGTGYSNYTLDGSAEPAQFTWTQDDQGQIDMAYEQMPAIPMGSYPLTELTEDETILANCPASVEAEFYTEGHTVSFKEEMDSKTAVSWTDRDFIRPVEPITCANGETYRPQAPQNGGVNMAWEIIPVNDDTLLALEQSDVIGEWSLSLGNARHRVEFLDDLSITVEETGESGTWALSDDGKHITVELPSATYTLAMIEQHNGMVNVLSTPDSGSDNPFYSHSLAHRIETPVSLSELDTSGDTYYLPVSLFNRAEFYDISEGQLIEFSTNYRFSLSAEPDAQIITGWDEQSESYTNNSAVTWSRLSDNSFGVQCDNYCYYQHELIGKSDDGQLIEVNRFNQLGILYNNPIPTAGAE